MRQFFQRILLLLCPFIISCTTFKQAPQEPQLTSLHLVDQNGFIQTIHSNDRLDGYKNINFMSPQPYQKVVRVYHTDENNGSKAYLTSYYKSGSLRQYLEVENNRAFGAYKEWYQTGGLKIDCIVVGGMADLSKESEKTFLFDQESKAYLEDGQLAAIIRYSKGVLDGDSYYYHNNGLISKKIAFKYGLKEGEEIVYNNMGSIISTYNYQNGKKNGEAFQYFSNGYLKSRELYSYNELKEATYYNIDQKEIASIHLGSGFIPIYEDDKIIRMEEYKNGYQEGLVEVYNSSGMTLEHYHTKNGLKHGEELFYYTNKDPQPSKKLSIYWFEGVIQGKITTWYEEGGLESIKEMCNNKKHGEFLSWYKNGSLMLIEDYASDKLINGSYFKINSLEPISKVVNGSGYATLYSGEGVLIRRILYSDGVSVIP